MVKNNTSEGFTIIEMVVSLAVVSLFLAIFFQLYSVNVAQQLAVSRRAAAYDIATSNLNKISEKTGLPACTAAINTLVNASNEGAVIVSNAPSTPAALTWAGVKAANDATTSITEATEGIEVESLTATSLPSSTVQELRISYPRGCAPQMPVAIISIVNYGSESVRRASFIN